MWVLTFGSWLLFFWQISVKFLALNIVLPMLIAFSLFLPFKKIKVTVWYMCVVIAILMLGVAISIVSIIGDANVTFALLRWQVLIITLILGCCGVLGFGSCGLVGTLYIGMCSCCLHCSNSKHEVQHCSIEKWCDCCDKRNQWTTAAQLGQQLCPSRAYFVARNWPRNETKFYQNETYVKYNNLQEQNPLFPLSSLDLVVFWLLEALLYLLVLE